MPGACSPTRPSACDRPPLTAPFLPCGQFLDKGKKEHSAPPKVDAPPDIHLIAESSSLLTLFDDKQFTDLMGLLSYVDEYAKFTRYKCNPELRHFCPTEKPTRRRIRGETKAHMDKRVARVARSWWHYLLKCVKMDIDDGKRQTLKEVRAARPRC